MAVPDQSAANSNIVVAVPTVTCNANGTINKIAWTYQTTANSTAVSPAALIEQVILEVDRPVGTRVYNQSAIASSTLSHVLTDQTIPFDSSVCIYMCYNDTFGNHIVVPFYNDIGN